MTALVLLILVSAGIDAAVVWFVLRRINALEQKCEESEEYLNSRLIDLGRHTQNTQLEELRRNYIDHEYTSD